MKKVLNFLGVSPKKLAQPGKLKAISDGLLVSTERAEAWFSIATSNTDLKNDTELLDELNSIMGQVSRILEGKKCHLKILWSYPGGDSFIKETEKFYSLGDHERWSSLRASRMDQIDLPTRHVLLGIILEEKEGRKEKGWEALGVAGSGISKKELARLHGLKNSLLLRLQASLWRAENASIELISWMIASYLHSSRVPLAAKGVLEGAGLARLAASKIVPFADHVQIFDTKDRAKFVSTLVFSQFPNDLEIPQDQWLQHLANIPGFENDVPLAVEASARFHVLKKKTAIDLVEKKRTLAKSQRREAAEGIAEETGESVAESEAILRQTKRFLERGEESLVELHPRLTIVADSKEELDSKVAAVSAYFSNYNMLVEVGEREQLELFLEGMPGDFLRVEDLGQTVEDAAFFGSFFWGGSKVGVSSQPAIGFTTGSTPGWAQYDPSTAAARGDSTTALFAGRSGQGKSTALCLLLLEAVFTGGWAALCDFKGDLSGIVNVAREFGLPAGIVRVGEEYAGCADFFATLPVKEAILEVTNQLLLLLPSELKDEAVTLEAVTQVSKTESPASYKVIELLKGSSDERSCKMGEFLENIAATPFGSVIIGKRKRKSVFKASPGIYVAQFPGLQMPGLEQNPSQWDTSQRLAIALQRGFTKYILSISASPDSRETKKVVAIPEVHLMLRTSDGRAFLDSIARMGRACGTNLYLDTQDVSGVESMEGLLEQISSLFVFQFLSQRQQDTATIMLGLEPSDHLRSMIRNLGVSGSYDSDGAPEMRHGHCIVRDYKRDVATVQIDIPALEIVEMLNTNPNAKRYEDLEDLEDGEDRFNQDFVATAEIPRIGGEKNEQDQEARQEKA